MYDIAYTTIQTHLTYYYTIFNQLKSILLDIFCTIVNNPFFCNKCEIRYHPNQFHLDYIETQAQWNFQVLTHCMLSEFYALSLSCRYIVHKTYALKTFIVINVVKTRFCRVVQDIHYCWMWKTFFMFKTIYHPMNFYCKITVYN